MTVVNVHEAKTHLSRLLTDVERGESVVIARAGRPIAVLTAVHEASSPSSRRIGFLRGEVTVPDDFDRWGEDALADLFEETALAGETRLDGRS